MNLNSLRAKPALEAVGQPAYPQRRIQTYPQATQNRTRLDAL